VSRGELWAKLWWRGLSSSGSGLDGLDCFLGILIEWAVNTRQQDDRRRGLVMDGIVLRYLVTGK
jgi:hypothetical protein